jgi:hypothetical protein
MFFTRVGLEQATDEWVAAYKATRLIPRGAAGFTPAVVADLCCGIGGDLVSLAQRTRTLAVDQNPVAVHFAAANSGAAVRVADAAEADVRNVAAWHIDPDRRHQGRRTTSLEFCAPNLTIIESLLDLNANAAVKLAPATEVPTHWADRCELEWISRDRECRQLLAWHGDLAQAPRQRRATIVPNEHGLSVRTISGAPNQPPPIATKPDRYVYDIDPALLAAHLKGALAAEHGLSALHSGPTYLTGARPIADPALSCFEVTDVRPFEKRRLARHLREHSIGRLEIKKRGVDLDPDSLRRELKVRGDEDATLLVTLVGGRPAAILARRL